MDWAPFIAFMGTLFTGISTGMAVLWRWGAQQAEQRALRAESQVDKLLPAIEKLSESIEQNGATLKDQAELIRSMNRAPPRRGGER